MSQETRAVVVAILLTTAGFACGAVVGAVVVGALDVARLWRGGR